MKQGRNGSRTGLAAVTIAVALCALAAPARAVILLEQLPTHGGGPGSDTSFVNDFGIPTYEITADDFRFMEEKEIRQLRWWGFYGGVNTGSILPPATETMRVRIYGDDGANGLPGTVLYQETLLNLPRVLTGFFAGGGTNAREYQYDLTLAAPFAAEANRRYWLEMVQVGDINSLYRREYSAPPGDGSHFAVMNPIVGDQWAYASPQSQLSMQLIGVPEPSSGSLVLGSVSFLISFKRSKSHVTEPRSQRPRSGGPVTAPMKFG